MKYPVVAGSYEPRHAALCSALRYNDGGEGLRVAGDMRSVA